MWPLRESLQRLERLSTSWTVYRGMSVVRCDDTAPWILSWKWLKSRFSSAQSSRPCFFFCQWCKAWTSLRTGYWPTCSNLSTGKLSTEMMSNRVTVIGWDNVLLGDDSGFFFFCVFFVWENSFIMSRWMFALLRSALFWDVRRCRVVIVYRRFGTTWVPSSRVKK